jgi:dihydrodipicolinate synthase/N-acetylneuraminate lyase
MPFISAMKEILRARGVPVRPDVRAPVRLLTPVEREGALAAARRVGALA